jgi:hypothetical protein
LLEVNVLLLRSDYAAGPNNAHESDSFISCEAIFPDEVSPDEGPSPAKASFTLLKLWIRSFCVSICMTHVNSDDTSTFNDPV